MPSSSTDMADIERCTSPGQIPHLEPLSEPHSEVSSIHGPDSSPSHMHPSLGTLHGSVAPSLRLSREKEPVCEQRHFGQWMRGVTTPLKLSLVLENKGNVARDHLASERTYLAYVRTSLACASAGVALVQLFALSASSTSSAQRGGINLGDWAKPLGATVVLFGLGILILGLVRYFTTQSALIRGYFPVARNSITAVGFVLGSLVGIVFGILVAGTQR